jgi:hypothetical protein
LFITNFFEYKSKNELKAEVKAEQVKQRVEGVRVKDEDYNSDHDNYVASGNATEEDEPTLPSPKRQKVEKKETTPDTDTDDESESTSPHTSDEEEDGDEDEEDETTPASTDSKFSPCRISTSLTAPSV